jgi:glycosyltransferase involved in cell wall biosynthesis
MQRIRMSLPYFKQNGWEAEVVTVDQSYSDAQMDELLLETIPADVKVHTVKAFDKSLTAKFGFGNIAFRSYPYYRKKVNQLLAESKFDLIYFSTTQFAVCVLGTYWKKRFGIPYVIDMQDPWHSEYYRDKPKHQQPPKYWFSYRLNKYLEPKALKTADGLISVSESYITDLKERYPQIKNIPSAIITFGSFAPDLDIAEKNTGKFANLLEPGFKSIVYIGRGGIDMHKAIIPLFKAYQQAFSQNPELYSQLKFYFIGTSYASQGEGTPTILPLAKQYDLQNNVVEITDRISYFHTLATLQQADALFIPGSDDPKYTASKIYPYLLTKRPLLTIFNSNSPAIDVLKDCGAKYSFSYDGSPDIEPSIRDFLDKLVSNKLDMPVYNNDCIQKHDAQNMTKQQTDLFNLVLSKNR